MTCITSESPSLTRTVGPGRLPLTTVITCRLHSREMVKFCTCQNPSISHVVSYHLVTSWYKLIFHMLRFTFNISKITRYGKKHESDFHIYKSSNKMHAKSIFIYIRGGRMYGYVEGVFDNGCRSY